MPRGPSPIALCPSCAAASLADKPSRDIKRPGRRSAPGPSQGRKRPKEGDRDAPRRSYRCCRTIRACVLFRTVPSRSFTEAAADRRSSCTRGRSRTRSRRFGQAGRPPNHSGGASSVARERGAVERPGHGDGGHGLRGRSPSSRRQGDTNGASGHGDDGARPPLVCAQNTLSFERFKIAALFGHAPASISRSPNESRR